MKKFGRVKQALYDWILYGMRSVQLACQIIYHGQIERLHAYLLRKGTIIQPFSPGILTFQPDPFLLLTTVGWQQLKFETVKCHKWNLWVTHMYNTEATDTSPLDGRSDGTWYFTLRVYCCIPFHLPLAYVNHPTAIKVYHVFVWIEWLDTWREIRDVHWSGSVTTQGKKLKLSIDGTSFYDHTVDQACSQHTGKMLPAGTF